MKIHWFLTKPCLGNMAGFCLFLASHPAFALEYLPDMTVNPPRESLEQLVGAPQLLTEDDLFVAHERSIPDVIQGLPGLSLNKGGGYGHPTIMLMRGAGGQGVVTLDDIPLLPSLPGLQNLDTLPTEAIESAELVRGPGAIYHPFQTLGGTVRLYTQDREETGARLSVEGGSFGILRETLQGALAGSPGRMTVTLSRGDAFDGSHLASSADNPERDPFKFTQGLMRFSSDISSRVNWQGSMLYRQSRVGSDTLGLDKNLRVAFKDDSQSFGRGETWLAQNSLNVKLTPNWSSHLQLGYTQLTNTVQAGLLYSSLANRMYLATLRNQHTLIDNEARKLRWQLNWGAQARHEQGESRTRGFNEERTMEAAFLGTEAQYRAVSGEAGVRVEHFDRFGDHPLFKTAAAWHLSPGLTLRASGGTGYRIPAYTELLSLFFGNPQLQPERSSSGDLGVEWYPVRHMHITANGYYNRYDNLITQAYSPQRGLITINMPDADVAGMELSTQYAWTRYLDTGLSYTYSNSRDLQSGRRLPLRPPHIARIWGQQKFAGLPITLWVEGIIRSASWNDTANTIALGQSLQLNASIRYAVTKQFEVYLRGENLTNNRTTQFYSTDMPGVAVYGGFQLEL